jgi:hypothetical protein
VRTRADGADLLARPLEAIARGQFPRNLMNKRLLCLKLSAVAPVLAALAASNVALSADAPAADTQVEASSPRSLLDDRFMISLGTFLLSQKTKVEIDGAGGNGTEIDTEKDLGFKDADRFRLDATWRFAEKHKIRAMYFNVGQSATKQLERSITVDDTTYPVSATVTSKKSTDVYELAYEYSFLRRDNYEITASAGLHVMDFSFSMSGTGTVNGIPGQAHTETAAVTAPLPVFGLRGLWELAPNWFLDAQGQYFQLKIGDVDGRVTDFRAGVTWMFSKHVGVGAGYNAFTTKVNVTKEAFDGSMKWRYSGAQVFITGSF